MSNAQLETAIEAAWEGRDAITPGTTGETREAIEETLTQTDSPCPWTIVRSDDKRRARINAIRSVLSQFDYAGRDDGGLGILDRNVAGGVELWDA